MYVDLNALLACSFYDDRKKIMSNYSKNTITRTVLFFLIAFWAVITPAWAQDAEPVSIVDMEEMLDPDKVLLGETLFHDPRLSKNKKISCASCHDLNRGGVDRMPTSLGVSGKRGEVNAPTVYNATNNFVFFWDGRAGTLEDQIDGPIHNPDEMGSSWAEIVTFLKQDPEYIQAFERVYDQPPSVELVKESIVVFEHSLVTPDAPFDLYLRGDENAISEDARAGYSLFKKYGCASCHQGKNLGGNMYQKFGVIGDYFKDRGNPTKADLGRYNVTGDEFDRHVFKVPSLRNIAETAPYFHDGSVETLEGAVDVMTKYQVGMEITPDERDKIVEFLKSLTGLYKGRYLNEMTDE